MQCWRFAVAHHKRAELRIPAVLYSETRPSRLKHRPRQAQLYALSVVFFSLEANDTQYHGLDEVA